MVWAISERIVGTSGDEAHPDSSEIAIAAIMRRKLDMLPLAEAAPLYAFRWGNSTPSTLRWHRRTPVGDSHTLTPAD
ncbi:hypothetical protein SBBP1_1390004 [Burkholderiales bacterium]|nr:hypothetical protein SBBP1_1390004 [Burkholderiales bacterium]